MKPIDDGLKQRLIGAIILLALGVIFVPVLFDRSPIEPVDQTSQIPAAPEIITIDVQEPEPVVTQELAPPPQEMYVPDETQVADESPESPGLDSAGVPKSWVLQVGSFEDATSAEELRGKLVKNEFPAYIRHVKVGNTTVTRVLVGPKLDKNALLRDKQKIDRQFDVEALLLEFKP